MGIAENFNVGHINYSKPQGNPKNKGGEHYFIEKKEEAERSGYEPKSIRREGEFRVMEASRWQNSSGFSLAGLLLEKEKIFLPPARVCKERFFMPKFVK